MRRIIVSALSIVMAFVLASSCRMEEGLIAPEDEGRTVITAVADQIGAGTKVEMAYCYNALWQAEDQIYVKQGQITDTFTLVGGKGTTKGTFEGTKKITGGIEAFYPVSVGETMEWPSVQTNTQAVPMYANQAITGEEGETVNFSSLGAVLQIVLTTSEKSIGLSKIKLYDGDKPMSGEFTVEDGQAVITSTDKSGITLNLENVSIGNAAKYFNIAVPAGKYEDLHLEFTFDDGRTRKMVSTTMPEVKLNTVAKIAVYLDIALMPKSISLNYNILDLIPGDEYSLLKATILPENAANKNVIWSSSNEDVATVDQTGKVTAIAVGECIITATATDSWLTDSCALTVTETPSGALPGKFSVSEDKQVYFSKGNMYYGTWIYNKFHKEGFYIEEAQWGRQPITDSISWRTDHKNHFYWSKIDIISRWETYPPNEGHETTSDVFFTNLTLDTPHPDFRVIINGTERKGVWRVLSTEEWEYLFRKRKMTYDKPRCSNWLGGMKMADGVIYKGLFIYPDDFNGESIEFETDWGKRSWKDIYDAGIVFLPAGGIRQGKEVSRVDRGWAPIGWYWSSNCNDTNQKQAHSMYFNDLLDPDIPDKGIVTEKTSPRGVAHTVRLVRDVRE